MVYTVLDNQFHTLANLVGRLGVESGNSSGWFNAESMLYMAVVSVGTYSQASFEMGYAMK